MAAIIENGSGVPDANTYASPAELVAFVTMMNPEFDASTITADALAIETAAYIAMSVPCWQGERTHGSKQGMDWPRKYAVIHGEKFPSDAIPGELVLAQKYAALARSQGIALLPGFDPSSSGVKKEKLGPMETEFFGASDKHYGAIPILPMVNSLLRGLIGNGACGHTLRTIRV